MEITDLYTMVIHCNKFLLNSIQLYCILRKKCEWKIFKKRWNLKF